MTSYLKWLKATYAQANLGRGPRSPGIDMAGFLLRLKFMNDPDMLPVEGFRRVACGFSSAGWACKQCLRISGRGGSMDFATMSCSVGPFSFEAMTGSFRFWMEALRVRGNILVLHGVASATMVLDPYRLGFGAMQCLSDRCGPLRSILERW